ncbi:N-acetyltransferase [Streptomyces chrestomyceticus JCM 4735]|uniref:N-acetyltransferase n=1 Tax=Streptomyces chrestomyceticus JCM 4735 TaxID=1306181 RepID=A0A7U9PZY1_9ACTN|nr:GNAT family N-acetyltransferase [Streptomyces chrestomyceticus]GCD38977.1 N-acetyltransferase [Streptomyces chrestomyceticus JCM 4735]
MNDSIPDAPGERAPAAVSYGIPAGYEVSTDADRLDLALIHHWLSTDAYWALGRPRERQDRAVAGSLNFGLYGTGTADGGAGRGRQVGYARVVTDRTTFAWLCDVYVAPAARGKGLGTALVTHIRDHLAPYGLSRILLATGDAHDVYARVGFEPLSEPGKWMALGLQ